MNAPPRLEPRTEPGAGPAGLPWHEEDEWLGVRTRVFFFDSAHADALPWPQRMVPVLAAVRGGPAPALRVVSPESDGQRRRWRAGGIVAQPDAVLGHGEGLLSVLVRENAARLTEPARWREHVRPDVMLHALAAAMAVGGESQRPTAALWRAPDALFQFDPGSAVLECLAAHIGAAQRHWAERGDVTAAQLAHYCEPKLMELPGLQGLPRNRFGGPLRA